MKSPLKGLVVLFAIACVVRLVAGCASAGAAEAEATYLGQQLRCVDVSKTRDEADACRRKVRAAWGIAETARDGGDQ